MKESGKYRVTHHLGRGPDIEDAEVIFSYPDEEPARRFYQRHLPPRVGYVLALWRPDDSLIASTIGPQGGSQSSACPTSRRAGRGGVGWSGADGGGVGEVRGEPALSLI